MNVRFLKEIIKAQPRTFSLIMVLVLSNVSLFAYASWYQVPRIESLQGQRLEKRKAVRGGAVQDIAAIYQQGERDLKVWQGRIIQKREFARFLGSLFETAANNSLVFKGMSYKASQLKEEKNLITYSLDYNVSGKYAAAKSFISDILRMREIVTIDNLSLSNANATEDAVALRVQMTLYLRMEEQ